MVILTEELILSRSSVKSVSDVRNLNLWGSELENISALKKCSSLEVLSLSVNNLTSLEQLTECTNLIELYLRKNYITDVEQVKHLTTLRNLEVLWLFDNPCADDERQYRYTVLRHLPWLKKLDHHYVTDDEVLASMSSSPATMPLKILKRMSHIPPKQSINRSLSSDRCDKNFPNDLSNHLKANYNSENIEIYEYGILSPPPLSNSSIENYTPIPKTESKLAKTKSNANEKTNGQTQFQVKSQAVPLSRTLSRTPSPKVNNNTDDIEKNEPKQSNVLTAVLALIDELDEKDLQAVQRKLRLVMLNRRGQPINK